MFFAILFSDSIGITLSHAVHKNVDDLRLVRNAIAHICEAKLTDTEFQSYMARVLHSFTSLGLPVKEIEDVRKQTSFPTAELQSLESLVDNLKQELKRKEAHLQQTQNTLQSKEEEVEALTQEIASKVEPFCILASEPSHEVIKRSNDITRLKKKMKDLEYRSQEAVSTIYISGTPGCGKSQLARQLGQEFFCTRSREVDGLTFVATLNAESVETLADSYITLGKQLGITEYTLTNLENSKRVNPRAAIQHLKTLLVPKIRKYSKWLLIADNVIELCAVRSFLPQTGGTEWGHGQVLITTQDRSTIPRNSSQTYHESFSKGMQVEDAVKLLTQVSQIPNEAEQAKNVAKVLEYQPLALAAAGFYVQTVVTNGSPDYNWANYLEALREGQREATEQLLASESSAYCKTMTTAIQIALKRAVETDEVLRLTFSFLSLCSSAFLPVEAAVKFARAGIQAGLPEELIKAKILRSSLILFSPAEEDGPQCLRLHKTIHEVLKKEAIFQLEPAEKNQHLAIAMKILKSLLDSEIENFKRTGYSCAMLHKLTSHCKALLESNKSHFTRPESNLLKEMTSFITLEEVVEWLCYTANACDLLDDLTSANLISELACNLLKDVSNTWEGTFLKAMAFSIRGDVYNHTGKYQEAKELYENVLKLRQTAHGEMHATVEMGNIKLGDLYRSTGEYKAEELDEKAPMIHKLIDDEQHGGAAKLYSKLGNVYHHTGQYSQAKDLFEKALVIQKRLYGEEDATVALSYNDLGSVYNSMGKYNEAKRLHENALTMQTKIHGDEHARVADSYSSLGAVYENIGEYKKAKELLGKSLMIHERVYGEVHTAVARSYSNLGHVYHSMGEYDKAKDVHEKALMIQRKVCGEEHVDVAAGYNNVGKTYFSIGEFNQAKELFGKALAILKKIFGEEHPDVANVYNNLGSVYDRMAQYTQAKDLYDKALMIKRNVCGENSVPIAATYNNLGQMYLSIGEFNQAKELHKKALTILKYVYGEKHADVAASYNNFGKLYEMTGEYSKAKEVYEKALTIWLKVFGEKHAHVAKSYSDLGSVYDSLGDCERAKNLHEKALLIQKEIYGECEEYDDVATCYENLGLAYLGIGDGNKAKELCQKALTIRKKIHGEEHAQVAISYNNLAHVYYNIGEYNQAKGLQEKALKIHKKVFGEDNVWVVRNRSNLRLIKTAIEQELLKETDEAKTHIRLRTVPCTMLV